MGIQAFRFDKYLMRVPVGKTDNFIFNRRTITRPDAFNDSRIQRRPIQAGTDNIVGFTVGAGDMTGYLPRMLLALAHIRKHGHGIIAVLFFQFTKIDGSSVYTRRRSGF